MLMAICWLKSEKKKKKHPSKVIIEAVALDLIKKINSMFRFWFEKSDTIILAKATLKP